MTDQLEPSVGARAIDFELPTNLGSQILLSSYLPRKNVYLFFVREYN